MKKFFTTVLAVAAMTLSAKADIFTDAINAIDDIDLAKTPLAITNMAVEENVGMEVFRANGLRGDLYTGGHGVNLVKKNAILGMSSTMVVEGFYNGNFDLTVNYALALMPQTTLTARQTKPDGTVADYAGATEAKIVPCLVIKDFIYVPVEQIPFFGYTSKEDATGLQNMHFDAVTMPNIAEAIADIIPAETLAAIIKAAVDSQLQNETIKNLVGKIIDGVIGDGSDPSKYLSLLDGAKINAFRIVVDGKTVDTFNGFELHTIGPKDGATVANVTDRILPLKGLIFDSVKNDYATKSENDPHRSYRVAYKLDENNVMSVYNFNNAGMAIHSEALKDNETNVRKFRNDLAPVTGVLDLENNSFNLDLNQQLNCEPTLITDFANGLINSMNIINLRPVVPSVLNGIFNSNMIHPSWNNNTAVKSDAMLGKPKHTGENLWEGEDKGGKLVTVSNNAEITVGDYTGCDVTMWANGTQTTLQTSKGPFVYDSKWTVEGIQVEPITHKVNLAIEYNTEDGKYVYGIDGIRLWGNYMPVEHEEHVAGYELYLMPIDLNSVANGYESLLHNGSALHQHDENFGLNYRYNHSIHFSDFIPSLNVAENAVPVTIVSGKQKAAAQNALSFDYFVPYEKIKKFNAKTGILGTFSSWEETHPSSEDKYTVFVKTNYTPESGLQPTFHALTALANRNTTGVEDIATDNGNVQVSGNNGVITVMGSEGAPVAVYTVAGVKVAAADGDTAFNVASGAYIVTVGTSSYKLIVR